ncbi:hypothetical protein AAF712_015860 [Marasmius tenuissimus]|uniref:Chromo domain-containing protein n=1 Tax=Marasmius tenuissimus TaxID=585030 RepID=A0ABR2Z9P9_9AGAR
MNTESPDARQWGLATNHIDTSGFQPEEFIYHELTIPLFAKNASTLLEPEEIQQPLPAKFTYPLGRTFHLRDNLEYRCGCSYNASYNVPDDKSSEWDYLAQITTPPGTAPTQYNPDTQKYETRPIEGMVQLVPGIPFCVDLDGDQTQSITVSTLIDDRVLHEYSATWPDAKKAVEVLDELEEVTWATYPEGGEKLPAIYELEGLKPNMRSSKKPGKLDCSSSHASSPLEGNGKRWGVPMIQADSPDAITVRARILGLLSQLYWLVAPFALSLFEFDITTFRNLDLNIFSFGGILPTRLTGMQTNGSSGWTGGDLRSFIGLLQGSWHVDVKDDPCRWTMLVIQLWMPPGSDPGAFLLGRWGLYCRTEVGPSGRVCLILFFKGNNLHSGIAPTVDPAQREAFLRDLAGQLNDNYINRVVYVCYPTEVLTHREVQMATYASHGLSPNDSKAYEGLNYAKHRVPALGNAAARNLQLRAESAMTQWNETLQLEGDDYLPSPTSAPMMTTPSLVPLPTFKHPDSQLYVPMDPTNNPAYFSLRRAQWHHLQHIAYRYALRMTKYDYKLGQEAVLADYEEQQVVTLELLLDESQQALSNILNATGVESTPLQPSYSQIRTVQPAGIDVTEVLDDTMVIDGQSEDKTLSDTGMDLDMAHVSMGSSNVAGDIAMDVGSDLTPNDMHSPRANSNRHEMDADVGVSDDEDEDEDEEIELERAAEYNLSFIVTDRIENGIQEYLLRWKDHRAKDDTWEPEWVIEHIPSLIDEYRLRGQGGNLDRYQYNHQSKTYKAVLALMSPDLLALDNATARGLAIKLTALALSTILLSRSTNAGHIPAKLMLPVIKKVREAVEVTSRIRNESALLKIKQFALNQALSCALLFIYTWVIDYGPTMAYSLVCAHRKDPVVLAEQNSVLYPVVNLIVAQVDAMAKARISRKCVHKDLPEDERMVKISPDHVTGLLPDCRDLIVIDLSAINMDRHTPIQANIDKVALDIIQHFLTDHVIMAQAKAAFQDDSADQCAKHVCRGFLCEALLDVFDNDGMFCAENVRDALDTPWRFWGANKAPKVVAKAIQCDPDGQLKPIRRWLQSFSTVPDIQEQGQSLSESVHSVLQSVWKLTMPSARRACGRAHPGIKTVVLTPSGPPVPTNSPLAKLCPYEGSPSFGILSIMLQESSGTQLRDLDHYNPVRENNISHQLVQQNLLSCGEFLTSQYGLTNILVRLGTGQGIKTRSFLEKELKGQWFTSVEQCVSCFRAVYHNNEGKPKQKLTPISNGAIWGTYCYQLALDPSRDKNNPSCDKKEPPQFAKRFEPFFNSALLTAWKDFLGPSFDVDPATRPIKDRPTYEQTLNFIDKLKVVGFGPHSISRMQLANFLVIEGICQHPTVGTMARLTHRNNKGALEGLIYLGFDVANAGMYRTVDSLFVIRQADQLLGLEQVQDVFTCVYDFLDHHLSDVDKEELGFGAIFVEHLLCKVTQWSKLLKRQGETTFADLLAKYRNQPTHLLPFSKDRAVLKRWIGEVRLRSYYAHVS